MGIFDIISTLVMVGYGLPKARRYQDNGDGTVSDLVTGLMWQKSMGDKISWKDAINSVTSCETGGYTDWRMPEIRELYSLILYSGQCRGPDSIKLFIDDEYFDQPLGDTTVSGGRQIDAQTWSKTHYDGYTMLHDIWNFGTNFVDGRVKSYPERKDDESEDLMRYARYVRGNIAYGINKFVKNGDGTVSDIATGLMWAENDNGEDIDWKTSLAYASDSKLAGYTDWRLPTIKELNSIVLYGKKQGEAAINSTFFKISQTVDIDSEPWYPYFWSGSTLLDGLNPGSQGLYQTFGRALGVIRGQLVDAHGAGAIRSDPKSGDRDDYPSHETGFQGDVQYVFNYVRIVRDISYPSHLSYPIVETNISVCYNDVGPVSECPTSGEDYYGQDGNWKSENYIIGEDFHHKVA